MLNRTDNEKSITKCRRAPNPLVYRSMSLFNSLNNIDNQKNQLKSSEYSKYSNTTQIVGLPGGVKRDKLNIKDDHIIHNNKTQGHFIKQIRDYNSNITCLANKQVKLD
jgi:hypothetical protein